MNNARTYTDNAGLIVFSQGHYSPFSSVGERPDVPVGPGPLQDDEQRIAAFLAFRANAGTYETSGSKLTMRFMLARNPRVVGTTVESEYAVEGDTLVITGTNQQGVETRTTYARVD